MTFLICPFTFALPHVIDERLHHDFRFTISETRPVFQVFTVVDDEACVARLAEKHPSAVQKEVGALAYRLQLAALVVGLPKAIGLAIAQYSLARNLTVRIGVGLVACLRKHLVAEQQTHQNQYYNVSLVLHFLAKFGSKLGILSQLRNIVAHSHEKTAASYQHVK